MCENFVNTKTQRCEDTKFLLKNCVVSLCLCVFAFTLYGKQADGGGLESIRKQTIEAHLSFLASDALEGREAGKRGGRIAAEYIRAELKELGIKPFFDTHLQAFEAYSPAREEHIDFQVNPDSIARYKQLPAYRRLSLQNVVGYIEGERKEEYIVIGAHYDHVGIDDLLVGDQIYNGADDNAASVAALLQIVRAFAANGEKPLRSVIFAFWDGEEINYLGSEYFVENFGNTASIKAYINLDMISREGLMPVLYPEFIIPKATAENTATGNQFHLLYTEELTQTGERLQQDIRHHGLNITPKPAVIAPQSRGSDYLAFSLRNVPILWFFTGLHPDYHTPDDEIDRIDWEKLVDITKAVYITLKQLAHLHVYNKYYQSQDFYTMQSGGSLTLLENFKTYQQTTGVTCGPSCALMALDYFGKLNGYDEMTLKALRGTSQDTTYLKHLLNIFDAVGGVDYVSTFDYERKDITPTIFLDFLKKGAPVIIGTNEWGGHWQIVIGYDTMGTETTQDDVLILADPYDRTDHREDGYIVYPFENLYEGLWRNYYDPDFDWGLFVAVFPK